jgi:uncharacterized protein YdaU (DUF1376 family)
MHDVPLAESIEEIKPRRKRRTAQTHPWYKRYPRDFWMGTRGLSLEEYAAYDIILDWMYELGGPVPNDDHQITARLGCRSVRIWRRIRPKLFGPEKLFITPKGISNHRAEEELKARKFDETLGEDSPNFQPNLFENVIDFNARRTQSQIQIQITPTQEGVRVSFEDGKITLYGELRAYWLKEFGGDEKALELALIQAAGYVEPNGSRPLEAKVGAQLAKQIQWARERAAKADVRKRQAPKNVISPRRAWNGRPSAKETFARTYGVSMEDLD